MLEYLAMASRVHAQHGVARLRRLGVLCLVALCGACSILLPLDEPQCVTNADCQERNLDNAVCVMGLCERLVTSSPSESASSSSRDALAVMTSSGNEPTASRRDAEPDAEAPDSEPASAGGDKRADAGMDGSGNRARDAAEEGLKRIRQAAMSGSAGAAASSSAGSGAEMPATSGRDDTPGDAACPGAGCPECTVDADCERLGMQGALCVGSLCYTTQAECTQDEDCLALGAEYKGGRCVAQQCLPNPRLRCEPPTEPDAAVARDVSLPLLDGLTRATLANTTVLLCPKLDLTCAAPITQTQTDDKGMIHVTLPPNFSGYLQTEPRGYLPAMYFVPNVIPEDGVLDGFPLVGSGIAADALASSLGTSLDPKRGHMMVIAEDCLGDPVAGITFSSPAQDDASVVFYVYDQLPSTTAKVTADTGQGGFLNLPTGTPMVELRDTDSGLLLSKVSLVVRAGFISVAFIPPLTRMTHE